MATPTVVILKHTATGPLNSSLAYLLCGILSSFSFPDFFFQTATLVSVKSSNKVTSFTGYKSLRQVRFLGIRRWDYGNTPGALQIIYFF